MTPASTKLDFKEILNFETSFTIIFSVEILNLLTFTFLKYENIQKYTRVLKVLPGCRHCLECIPLPGYTEHNNPQVLLPWAFCIGNGIESILRPLTSQMVGLMLMNITENPVKSTLVKKTQITFKPIYIINRSWR